MLDNRLLTFLELCRTKSFTQTAENLHMSQPAVSQQVKYLETYYQTKLYEYTNRHFALTQNGKRLFRFASSVKADSESLRERLLSLPHNAQEIRLGIEVTAGESFMPKVIAAFLCVHPEFKISICIRDTDLLQKMLRNGQLDLIVVDQLPAGEDCDFHLLCSGDTLCVCAAMHPLAHQTVHLQELFQETLLLRTKDSPTYANLDLILRKNACDIACFKSVMEMGHIATAKEMLKQNIGISFFYHCVVESELESGLLSQILVTDFIAPYFYYFAAIHGSFFQNEHSVFFDFCKNYLQNQKIGSEG